MKLADVCKTFTSGGTPSRKRPEFFANGNIPWVKTKELNDGVVTEVEEFITPDAVKNSSAKLLPQNTVLLAMYGATVGKLGVLGIEAACNQACAAMIPKDGVVDFRFLYYLLMRHRDEIIGQATGGAQQNLSGELIKGFTFDFPTFKEQQAISTLLWALDEKIVANRDASKTLEDIAQAFFKSWFIDFDPVIAKMVGEKPVGIDDATATLFPDSMEDSELGKIPKGWAVEPLSDIGEFRNGLAMQKYPVVDEEHVLPVIKIAQLRAGNTDGADMASGLIDPKFVISDGDILFSWSGTLEIEHWAGGQGALNQHLFKVLGKTVPDWFVYYSSRNHLPEFRKIASGKATTMGHIQRGHLAEAKVAVPPVELLNTIGELLRGLVAQKVALVVQNRALADLRDALLPRLISGELQIPEEMLVP
jgi:type I restriction enzyme S subunit